MESKHLVGGIGMTTTGEQVTVIVYVTKSSASPTTCMLSISTRLTVTASWPCWLIRCPRATAAPFRFMIF